MRIVNRTLHLVFDLGNGAERSVVPFLLAHYGMKPDLITIAKGLTSADAPLSSVIVSEKVWQVLV